MMRSRILALLLLAPIAAADRYGTRPEATLTCSWDRSYCVVVWPKPFESKRVSTPDEPRSAGAAVQRAVENGYEHVAAFPLLNRIAPERVLVSTNGDLVTIDNWREAGVGDNVVALYRKDGTLVKQYSLEQLMSADHIQTLPHTITTIWWGGDHFLDEKSGHIVLMILKERSDPSNPQYVELRLDLNTGEKTTCDPRSE
jgi:hypothetical protein